MIDDLLVGKTASFYALARKLSDKAIRDLFTEVRASQPTAGNAIFRHEREPIGNAKWSALSFLYDGTPAFLDPTTEVRERLCGYLFIVEYGGHVAVFGSRLSLPSRFKTTYLMQVSAARMEVAIAKQNAVFHKMRMRNMSVSRFAMRSKTLEAVDLASVVGPGGSRRYAPQAYSVMVDGVQSTATPSTGRVAVRSDKVGHLELVDFAKSVIDDLRNNRAAVSPFIRTFARPISLADVLSDSEPSTLAIDIAPLLDAVSGDAPTHRLVRGDNNPVVLTEADLQALVAGLDQSLELRGEGRLREAFLPGTDDKAASVSLNKTRIALRSLDLQACEGIEVEDTAYPLGQDPERRALRYFLDESDCLVVLFDDVRLAYIGGSLFRDETLIDGGAAFLGHLHVSPALDVVTSEKGQFAAAQTDFDATSTFGAIVGQIAVNDTILVCDDLGDEWADFIGVRTDNELTQVSFYHGKHGPLSLGASPFHVSVSQALKNLGNMSFPAERMAAKVARWSLMYANNNQITQIARLARGDGPALLDSLGQTRSAPEVLRRAVIVTSSLSKQAVANTLAAAQAGQTPPPAFVQLYHLLQSFFSDCADAGVVGLVICRA